ncbi:RNA polymerase sigma-70 factor [Phaeodactylibacter sp.]|uniref:RNA polymerase sigma factor n=1 Tax=Phaeodactylibacter sp. TaxID=1940289 RepID=UPI0025CE7027|nr:RNA polymerase sigma-70 factor [Phaeodactylibacter sp.]MCI4650524.1 RNA polymerase sigma-70 factor [Phaeodactylibacter sp.]MCI5090960.1 RNA polymerase sigma-70 factor [Phaeodactylibacter sp.]
MAAALSNFEKRIYSTPLVNIVRAIKSGDESEFRSLYDNYFRRVYFFALKSVKDPTEAEDLSQNIFLKAWENRHRFKDDLDIEPQLFQIAKSTIIDYFRAKTTQQQLIKALAEDAPVNRGANPPQFSEQSKVLIYLQKAIEDLPPKRREVFKLSRYHGLTYDEIAQELSISKNTVHVHITKALATLRKKSLPDS